MAVLLSLLALFPSFLAMLPRVDARSERELVETIRRQLMQDNYDYMEGSDSNAITFAPPNVEYEQLTRRRARRRHRGRRPHHRRHDDESDLIPEPDDLNQRPDFAPPLEIPPRRPPARQFAPVSRAPGHRRDNRIDRPDRDHVDIHSSGEGPNRAPSSERGPPVNQRDLFYYADDTHFADTNAVDPGFVNTFDPRGHGRSDNAGHAHRKDRDYRDRRHRNERDDRYRRVAHVQQNNINDHDGDKDGADQGHNNGDQGKQGDHGEQGDHGNQGDHPDQGDHDNQSDHPDQRDQPVQGDQGDHHNQGDHGDQGDHGNQGDHGKQGDPGDQGDPDNQGDNIDHGDKGQDQANSVEQHTGLVDYGDPHESHKSTPRYQIFEIPDKGASGRRAGGGGMRRFLQEERADGVSIVKLGDGPFPEFRLPPERRQYMPVVDPSRAVVDPERRHQAPLPADSDSHSEEDSPFPGLLPNEPLRPPGMPDLTPQLPDMPPGVHTNDPPETRGSYRVPDSPLDTRRLADLLGDDLLDLVD